MFNNTCIDLKTGRHQNISISGTHSDFQLPNMAPMNKTFLNTNNVKLAENVIIGLIS